MVSIVKYTNIVITITMYLCQGVSLSMLTILLMRCTVMRRLRVREVAQSKGIGMAKLSRMADLSYRTVQSVWHNPQHDVSFFTLDKIAKALDVPVTALIEDVPEP
jgi:DNA-binding Xre family transcriptional regulator